MDARLRRIFQEAALAACLFSQSKRVEVDPDEGRWVLIYDFPLPQGYNRPMTHILIRLPPNYPLTPPDWFYLDRGVRRADGRPPHYFEDDHIPQELRQKGWAGGCLHIREWRPGADPLWGHSLLTVCKLIADALRRWLG